MLLRAIGVTAAIALVAGSAMAQDSERFHAEELFKCYAEYVVRAHERIMLLEAALAECADALETAQQLTLVREIRELLADKSVHALRQLIDEHGGAMEHEHGGCA